MHRIILILLFFSQIGNSWSQQNNFSKPQYQLIRAGIFDSNSTFFYPNLYDRYLNGDTSLTVEDFRHLYYGYTFQSQYEPYKESRYEGQMLSYLKKGRLSGEEIKAFIKVAELKLKELPFDLRTLTILAYSYEQDNDSLMASITSFKKNMLVKAIFSSGNGKTENTAYHVIDPSHQQPILAELGLKFAGTGNLANPMREYLIVQPNPKNIRGVYFDVGRIFKAKAERQGR